MQRKKSKSTNTESSPPPSFTVPSRSRSHAPSLHHVSIMTEEDNESHRGVGVIEYNSEGNKISRSSREDKEEMPEEDAKAELGQ